MSTAAARAVLAAEEGGRWRVVVAAYFGVMVGFGSMLVFTFSVFLKPVTAEFGWSREAASAAFGLAAMSVAVSSPVLGRMLDRWSPRRIIVPAMALFGVAFGSLGLLTPSLAHLYAVFVVMGIVGNATTQMGYSRAVASWFERRRGVALALVMAGAGTGAMIFPPLAQFLIGSYGWRSAYFVLGAAVLVAGIPLTALYVDERRGRAGEGKAAAGCTVGEGVRSRPFWLIVATLVLGSVSVNGAITHLSPLLTDRGVTPGGAALAASVLGLASFCGRIVTGVLLDRFFGPRVGMVLAATMGAGILVLAVARSEAMGLAGAALIGFGLGGEADVTPYLLSRYFGLRSFSTLYGLTWTAYAMAGAAGPVIMGRAYDVSGSYSALLTVLAAATFVSALLFLAMPRLSGGWRD